MADAESTYSFVPRGATVWSVSQLNAAVKTNLEQAFPQVWVEGEISDLSFASSGHVYLTLKDQSSVVRAVIFRTQLERLTSGVELKDGLGVVALGSVTVYSPRGNYQLSIERLYSKGFGAAELALRDLREKLTRLGYFDPRRKRKLPRFPKWIGLVASASGAAVHDMIKVLGRRWPAAKVFVRPSRVQGEGAAEEIADAIRQINHWKAQRLCATDVIILGRGGGSSEDLNAFNQEIVAQAIFQSKIPVVSAVGHETDVTIADLVADVRAATPSHAAEEVAPDRLEWIKHVKSCADRMTTAQSQRLRMLQRQIDDLAGRRVLREPLDRVRGFERQLDELSERLSRIMQTRLEQVRRQLDASTARLESLSPLNVLARGYSMTSAEASGAILRSAAQAKPGDRIVTRLQQGRLTSRVEAADPQDS